MRIAIDIDDVIVEFVRGYLEFYNKIHDTRFKIEEMYSYNLEYPLNTTEEKVIEIMFEFFETSAFDNLEFVEGVGELVSELSKNHEVFFITARSPRIKEKTRSFLEKHFPDISMNILHSGDYYGERKTKAEICLDQGIKFLMEDNKIYALDCAKKGVKVFLLEKPWNKNHEEHPNIIKISHLKEVLEQIK